MNGGDSGIGRPMIAASLLFHAAAFLVALGVPRLLVSSSGMGPVYVVDLVSPPGLPGPEAAAPPAAAAPAPAAPPKATAPPKASPKAPPKKPVEKAIVLPDRNAKKTPDKKAIEKKPVEKTPEPKQPEPVKTTDPEAEETAAATAAEDAATAKPEEKSATTATKPGPTGSGPAGSTGSASGTATAPGAGGTGSGPGGGGDEYTFYLSLLKKRIEQAWNRPVYTGPDTRSATVSLTLSRTGRVLRLELSSPSGYEPLDRSLLRAVRDAEPFPLFPTALTLDTLPVQIQFDLKPEGSDAGNPGD